MYSYRSLSFTIWTFCHMKFGCISSAGFITDCIYCFLRWCSKRYIVCIYLSLWRHRCQRRVVSQWSEKWKFWPPIDLKRLKIVQPKLVRMILRRQPRHFCGNRSNGVCSPYYWTGVLYILVTLYTFPFLLFPSLFFLVVSDNNDNKTAMNSQWTLRFC